MEYLPLTVFVSIILLYVVGLFDNLLLGVYILLTGSALCYVFSGLYLCKTHGWRILIKELTKDYMILYILVYCIIIYSNYQKVLVAYDDLEHWGLSVKEMCRWKTFTLSADTYDLAPGYPPAMALFQYFVQELRLEVLGADGFSEWWLFVAYQVVTYAFFLPAYEKIMKNSIKQKVIIGVIWFMLPMIVLQGVFLNNIYIDTFLSVLAVGAIITMQIKDITDINKTIYFTCLMIMLTLTKDIGLIFSFMFSLFYMRKGILKRKYHYIFPFLFSVLVKVSWSAKIMLAGVESRASSFSSLGIDLFQIPRDIIGMGEEYRHQTFINYWHAFFAKSNINIGDTGISISFCTLFILLVILTVILINIEKETKEFHLEVIMTVAIYLVALCVFYMYIFSENQALELASYKRYVSTIFNFWVIVDVIFVLQTFSGKFEKGSKVVICELLILLCIPIGSWFGFLDRSLVDNSISCREQYREDISILQDNVSIEQKVYVINTVDSEMEKRMSFYNIFFECDNLRHAINQWGGIIEKDSEAWRQELFENYDYVYLRKVDETFIKEYGRLFEKKLTLKEKQLYYVERNKGQLVRVL